MPACKKCGVSMRKIGSEKSHGLVEVHSFACDPCGEVIAVPVGNITKQK